MIHIHGRKNHIKGSNGNRVSLALGCPRRKKQMSFSVPLYRGSTLISDLVHFKIETRFLSRFHKDISALMVLKIFWIIEKSKRTEV